MSFLAYYYFYACMAYVCVYICFWIHLSPVCVRVCVCRPEIDITVILSHSLPQFLRQALSQNTELLTLAGLAGQWAPETLLSPPPGAGITGLMFPQLHFHGSCRSELVLVFAQKHLTNWAISPSQLLGSKQTRETLNWLKWLPSALHVTISQI